MNIEINPKNYKNIINNLLDYDNVFLEQLFNQITQDNLESLIYIEKHKSNFLIKEYFRFKNNKEISNKFLLYLKSKNLLSLNYFFNDIVNNSKFNSNNEFILNQYPFIKKINLTDNIIVNSFIFNKIKISPNDISILNNLMENIYRKTDIIESENVIKISLISIFFKPLEKNNNLFNKIWQTNTFDKLDNLILLEEFLNFISLFKEYENIKNSIIQRYNLKINNGYFKLKEINKEVIEKNIEFKNNVINLPLIFQKYENINDLKEYNNLYNLVINNDILNVYEQLFFEQYFLQIEDSLKNIKFKNTKINEVEIKNNIDYMLINFYKFTNVNNPTTNNMESFLTINKISFIFLIKLTDIFNEELFDYLITKITKTRNKTVKKYLNTVFIKYLEKGYYKEIEKNEFYLKNLDKKYTSLYEKNKINEKIEKSIFYPNNKLTKPSINKI